jgi:urate oxidase
VTRFVMGHMRYGKSDIRLVRVVRASKRHELKDVRVEVLLEGELERGYLFGDNRDWMSTDTIRNRVYAEAKSWFTSSIEAFGVALVRSFVAAAPQATRATVTITQRAWSRIEADGQPHDHAFSRDAGLRTACVAGDGRTFSVESGVRDLSVLKTTQSGWQGYLKDEFTTLPETADRILATDVTAIWQYANQTDLDFDRLWTEVRQQLLCTFGDHYSPGAQNDIYLMGKAVLERFPDVKRIQISLPNNHHLLYDLERFGIANDLEIFHASGDPHGILEGTVERSD